MRPPRGVTSRPARVYAVASGHRRAIQSVQLAVADGALPDTVTTTVQISRICAVTR